MRPLIEHLNEARYRIVYVILFFIVGLVLGIGISPFITRRIIQDLSVEGIVLVSLTPTEFFYTQLLIGFFFALIVSSPVILYQGFQFIKPGAKRKELIAIRYFLPAFLLLFFIGAFFAYAVFLRVALFFLASLSSLANVQNMWSIYEFIYFILITCLVLGIVFELPLVLVILKKLNLINEKILSRKRAHVYVALFIIAAIITPPDAVTQIIVALPLILLYELSIWLMKLV